MKTRKQIFHLRPPEPDKYLTASPSYFEPVDQVLILTVRMYDHCIVMPELVALIEKFYFEN